MTENVKCSLVYEGSKLFWRTRNTIDVTIVQHFDCGLTEVVAYEPSIDVEAERIYLNSDILRMKLDQVQIDSKFSFAKQNNVPISTSFSSSVLNNAITDFLLSRLIISEFKREECRFVVTLEFRSSDGDNIDELVCAKAAALHPFETKNYKLLAPGEVDAALEALEEEKRGLDVTCAQAAILAEEAHAPLSSKERWRIPIVLIKMDKGKVLNARDAKIWAAVSHSLKTQADIKRATEVTVQTVTSPAQLAAEKAAVKPLNTLRQVVDAMKPHSQHFTRVVGASVCAGVGADIRPRDPRVREKIELSTRRTSSPQNSGRIPATPRNSSRLLAGTAASQARAQCALEDNQSIPKVTHKKLVKRASSRSGHNSNNTSKRSLRMSTHSDSRDNSDAASDLCVSPDAEHSGLLDFPAPLLAIGENTRAGFASQVAAGLSSFAASFSAKTKAPAATEKVKEEAELETGKYNDLNTTEVVSRRNSLKPGFATEKLENRMDDVLIADVKDNLPSSTRRSYFGALLATLVLGGSGQEGPFARASSSESLTNGDKAGNPSVQDVSLSKKPAGMSSWLPWRPFGAAAVVPVE